METSIRQMKIILFLEDHTAKTFPKRKDTRSKGQDSPLFFLPSGFGGYYIWIMVETAAPILLARGTKS